MLRYISQQLLSLEYRKVEKSTYAHVKITPPFTWKWSSDILSSTTVARGTELHQKPGTKSHVCSDFGLEKKGQEWRANEEDCCLSFS